MPTSDRPRRVARTVLIVLAVPLLAFPLIALPLMVLTVSDVVPVRIGDWAAAGLAVWFTIMCLIGLVGMTSAWLVRGGR